jgi:hypothetical protein
MRAALPCPTRKLLGGGEEGSGTPMLVIIGCAYWQQRQSCKDNELACIGTQPNSFQDSIGVHVDEAFIIWKILKYCVE